MKLSELASSATTTLQLQHPVTKEPIDVFIEGHTPDSTEWKALEKQINGQSKQSMYLEKKGEQRIDIDPKATERNNQLLAAVVTDIRGLEDWECSPENVKALFGNPQYSWILGQWREHLDDRANFFGSSDKKLKPKSSK